MQGKWLPNESQYQLLKAVLLSGDDACQAWQSWRRSFDLQNVDPVSYQFLPQLYYKLQALQIDDPNLKYYKGIYFSVWSRNQLAFFQLSRLLHQMNQIGIKDIVLLKGAAMILFYYRDHGLRMLGDFDILIRKNDVFKALQLLTSLGWKPRNISIEAINETYLTARHGVGFINENNGPRLIDLHWNLLPETSIYEVDESLFDRAMRLELYGVEVKCLDPANLLLHICAHGAKASPVPVIRWILDAVTIIRKSNFELHWDDLIAAATTHHLTLYLHAAMSYLQQYFDIQVPDRVLLALSAVNVTRQEQRLFYLKTAKHTNYIIAATGCIWYQHCNQCTRRNTLVRLAKFPTFLQQYWGLKHYLQLPPYLFYKITTTLYSMLRLG